MPVCVREADHTCRGVPTARLLVGQVAQRPQRIGDQGVDEFGAGLLVVPGDAGFAGIGVVVRGALNSSGLGGVGHFPDHRADGGDELGDSVLGGHRVVQHGGVH